MINKRVLILLILFTALSSCSFDNKTGIWGDAAKEKKRISELENEQQEIIKIEKIYTSDKTFYKEIALAKNIVLPKPQNKSSWVMSNENYQNDKGNIYLKGINNFFFKKKIGKDKFSGNKKITSLLVLNNNIVFSDDKGTIFHVNERGGIIWKKNIYKKAYKKIYKNLVFSIYKDNIYVADNIGFIYSINLNDGQILWIRNYEIGTKSNIKVFSNKIFLINEDNKILCLNIDDGSLIWSVLSKKSFIKTENLLSLALTNDGNLLAITSAADIYKIRVDTGDILWSRNTADSLYADATDFFISSEIVINDDKVIFSSGNNTFLLKLENGETLWKQEVSSVAAPIVSGENIFILSDNGYLVIIEKDTGEIISSSNILKILKRKKQKTKITGFIMGSNKIYSITLNGFLISSSAISGKAEFYKKIGGSNISPLAINNGKLYILTDKSKILVLN
tara:strand:- start:804 stop:2153 length:1350 start_codon:yes stop_codon:yes gene_type:complete